MKTYHIKDLLKKDLLIVELPENKDIDFYEHGRELLLLTKGYRQLGKPDEISADDAAELIPMHYDYAKTAVEYIIEALESEIFWDVNPLGNEPELEAICCGNLIADAWGHPQCCGVPNATEESIELHSMWHRYELRTFDRSRSIILVKQ